MDILGRAFHVVNEHKGTDADENKDAEDGGDVSRRHHVSICTSRNEPPVGASSSEANRLLELNHVLGKGSFGTVYACTYKGDRDAYCVKRARFDPGYYNREMDIMERLLERPHPNVLLMVDYYVRDTSKDANRAERVSERVSEYYIVMPRYACSLRHLLDLEGEREHERETPYKDISDRDWDSQRERALSCESESERPHGPKDEREGRRSDARRVDYVRLARGVLRGLRHVHSMGLMHRDVKPDNILYDEERREAVLADFGSAKAIGARSGARSGPHTPYVCTRWYRAPELLLSSQTYDGAVDVWAAGCVILEMFRKGKVVFAGEDNTAQLCAIFRLMGIPSADELREMNDELTDEVIEKTISRQNKYRRLNRERSLQRMVFPERLCARARAFVLGCVQFSPSARNRFMRTSASF